MIPPGFTAISRLLLKGRSLGLLAAVMAPAAEISHLL